MSKTAKLSGSKPSVVFFGSGPVASKSLELLARNFDIEAVVTKPKPDHHKEAFPVLDSAKKLNLPVYTVSNKADLSHLIAQKPFSSNLGILIDFGIIVAQDVIDYFPLGIINSHFSVLPEWRGADPITFSILSGQKSTGVSLMLLVEKMDEGPLLSFGEFELPPDITTPQLTEHLINFSNQMLINEIPRYITGAQPSPQSITGRKASYSRKLTKQDGVIDWNKPADQIEREVRAFAGWPKSKAKIAGKDIIITEAQAIPNIHSNEKPGNVLVESKSSSIAVATADGSLLIKRLKPAGKKEMTSREFLAGHKNLL